MSRLIPGGPRLKESRQVTIWLGCVMKGRRMVVGFRGLGDDPGSQLDPACRESLGMRK